MKIVVTNGVVSNTGDAAIFAGIREALLTERITTGSEITLLDSNARQTARRYPEWNIIQQIGVAPPRRWMKLSRGISRLRRSFAARLAAGSRAAEAVLRLPLMRRTHAARALRALSEADLVISTGGTYLVDHYDFTHRVLELELAKRLGRRVVLWTQSVGPFKTPRSQSAIQRIIACVDAAYFRDEPSRDAWVREGGDLNSSFIAPDAVFALDASTPASPSASDRVLISVREWPYRGAHGQPYDVSRYEAAMRAAAEHALTADGRPVAMSTCQGLPRYVDDSVYAKRLFAGRPVAVNTDFHTPDHLLAELRDCRVVVTTRMHLAILAIISRVPVIAVAYEFKTIELFTRLGLGRFVVPIEDVTPQWMEDALDALTAEPESARLEPGQVHAAREMALLPARHLSTGSDD